jgi:hypothetical protein
VPTDVPGIEDAVQLSLNDGRSCARLAGGGITCWGQASRGADWLPTVDDARQVALGDQAACVVSAAGTLACSGGQPATLEGWTAIAQVRMAVRTQLACVLHVGGAVDCWGDNFAGQRGLGNTDPNIPFPGDPPAIAAGVTAVALGWSHVCALAEAGTVQCWGRNGSGAVGRSMSATASCSAGPCQLTPFEVANLPPAAYIAAGGASTCAMTADGRLFCWGQIAGEGSDGKPIYTAGPWE